MMTIESLDEYANNLNGISGRKVICVGNMFIFKTSTHKHIIKELELNKVSIIKNMNHHRAWAQRDFSFMSIMNDDGDKRWFFKQQK
jgi:hypothetical protein